MAKKKIKKFLKKVAPLAIAGLGAAMLGKNRRRKAMLQGADANEGFVDTISKMSSKVYPDAIMRGGKGAVIPDNLPVTSANVQRGLVDPPLKGALNRIRSMDKTGTAGDIMGEASMLGFKKGGRVGCGIAKRGFGKAMKRRKK